MKKLIALLLGLVILSSCSVTYYTYYEVENLEEVTMISRQDAEWSSNRKSPTRCVDAYQKDGKTVYLIETEVKEKLVNDIDYD